MEKALLPSRSTPVGGTGGGWKDANYGLPDLQKDESCCTTASPAKAIQKLLPLVSSVAWQPQWGSGQLRALGGYDKKLLVDWRPLI